MGKASEESAFLRGDIGVDGQAVEEVKDEGELEQTKVMEELVRGRTYLGREFLTWLLWRTNEAASLVTIDNEPITVVLVGRVVLRGLAGEATELNVKGVAAPYSAIVRRAIGDGLLLHVARLRIQHGEKLYEATVDAEHLAVRSAKIPKVLSEEDDDKITERLFLAERLSQMVDALFQRFMKVRITPEWAAEVKALRGWIEAA
jgi:hypothetical protein